MPRSYDKYTKIWVSKQLRDRLESLRRSFNCSFEDLFEAFLNVSLSLEELGRRIEEILRRKRGE